jgi:hypothetical protein
MRGIWREKDTTVPRNELLLPEDDAQGVRGALDALKITVKVSLIGTAHMTDMFANVFVRDTRGVRFQRTHAILLMKQVSLLQTLQSDT